MEEQILKIIENCTDTDYLGNIDGDTVKDFNKIEAVRQIASHVMEFILWIIADSHRYFEQGYSNGKDHFYEMESGDEVTFDEVCQYWLSEVKNN
jgi:hypothetical protein